MEQLDREYQYFVGAAQVAASLEQANNIAKQLSITASNARAVALRAGQNAAGFKPLTDFIDQLANTTISSSKNINELANKLSRNSANKYRIDNAFNKFNGVLQSNNQAKFNQSLDQPISMIVKQQQALSFTHRSLLEKLSEELILLSDELRTAVVLATLSRVEASQADTDFQDTLYSVADNVEEAATKIKAHILSAIEHVNSIKLDRR